MPDEQLAFEMDDDDEPSIPSDGATPARRGDPETSREAAESVFNLTAKRRAVLVVLADAGERGLSDYELAERYSVWYDLPPQSPSGLRTRRRELTDAGLVRDTGVRVEHQGDRRHILWAATDAGCDLAWE